MRARYAPPRKVKTRKLKISVTVEEPETGRFASHTFEGVTPLDPKLLAEAYYEAIHKIVSTARR